MVYVCYTPQKYPFNFSAFILSIVWFPRLLLSLLPTPPRSQIFNCHSYFIFGCSLVICVLGDEGLCFCSVSLCWTPLVCIQQYLVLCGRGEMCNFAECSFQKTRKRSFNCTVYFNGLLFFYFLFFSCWEVSIILRGNLWIFLFWQMCGK